MNNQFNEDTAPFISDSIVDNREGKEEILRNILSNDEMHENDDGVIINHNKFLYLYGPANSGKLTILQKIAQEVYGANWESKIYLREDTGQRYPYKLHAHKVESSRRVIFVTTSRMTWAKWRELYPSLRTIEFRGSEAQVRTDGRITIQYSEYFQTTQRRKEQFKQDIQTMLTELCQQFNLSPEVCGVFHQRILARIRNDWANQLGDLTSSEVIEHTP